MNDIRIFKAIYGMAMVPKICDGLTCDGLWFKSILANKTVTKDKLLSHESY